jgi:hypothetical protein
VRAGLTVIGLLVLLVGVVFAGQGLGYIPGSFMTGDIRWFWIGLGLIVVGAAMGAAGLLRPLRRI